MIQDNLELFLLLTQREILGPYKGAALGIWWSAILPLITLSIYTLIFTHIFQPRWSGNFANDGRLGFAVNLFAGLIVFNLFGDCMRAAPRLITGNPNFIKKIIFPVELLGAVTVGGSCFKATVSFLILGIVQLISNHKIPLTIAWIPLVWLPLVTVTLSLVWMVAAVGVFMRDIDQAIGVGLNLLMFASPVLYPASALPLKLQTLIALNPLAHVIEQTRRCSLHGLAPSSAYLLIAVPSSLLLCELSYRIFYKARRAFADEI